MLLFFHQKNITKTRKDEKWKVFWTLIVQIGRITSEELLATDPHRPTQTLELVLLKMPTQWASITRDVIEYREKAERERINEFILFRSAFSPNFKQNPIQPFFFHLLEYNRSLSRCVCVSLWLKTIGVL